MFIVSVRIFSFKFSSYNEEADLKKEVGGKSNEQESNS